MVDFTGNGELDECRVECDNLGDIFFAQYELGESFVEIGPAEHPSEIALEAALTERSGRSRR